MLSSLNLSSSQEGDPDKQDIGDCTIVGVDKKYWFIIDFALIVVSVMVDKFHQRYYARK